MRAWLVEQITEAGDMALADCPAPAVGANGYLVRVEYAGVNFLDTLMLRGRYQRKPSLPFTPGSEVSGTIVACGPGTVLPVGQRVCASMAVGGYAELAAVPAEAARAIPDDVPSDAALVLLGINYPTSYYALHNRACLRPGETVLVHAAAGGVGSAAVQIAAAAGCRVIATAGSEEKLTICRQLGAETALDYTKPGWVDHIRTFTGGNGVDVVYDPVGGDIGVQSVRNLAWRGRYLVVGFTSGGLTDLPANRLLLKDASAMGVFWGEVRTRDPDGAELVMDAVLELYRAGKIDPLIGGRFPLDQARDALDQLGRRQTVGKILLTP